MISVNVVYFHIILSILTYCHMRYVVLLMWHHVHVELDEDKVCGRNGMVSYIVLL
jgi:hypothetical protein